MEREDVTLSESDSEIENIVNWYKANKEWLSRGVLQVNKNRKGRLFLNNLES